MQYTCCCRLPISHFCEFFFSRLYSALSVQFSVFEYRSLVGFAQFFHSSVQLSGWFRIVSSSFCADVNHMNEHLLSLCSCSFLISVSFTLATAPDNPSLSLAHGLLSVYVRLHKFFLCLSFKYFLRNSVRYTYQTPNKQQQKVFMLFR